MTYIIIYSFGLVIKPNNRQCTIWYITEAAKRTLALSTKATIFLCDLWHSRATTSNDERRPSAKRGSERLT